MKKTTILTQLTIVGLCAGHSYYTHAPLLATLILFAVMELGGLAGTLWAARNPPPHYRVAAGADQRPGLTWGQPGLPHRQKRHRNCDWITTSPLRACSPSSAAGQQQGVPIIPFYDSGDAPAELLAEAAALTGADAILLGSSRRSTLHRLIKGSFQRKLELLLPVEVAVHVLDAVPGGLDIEPEAWR